jgi:hypothetical protein
MAVMNWVWPITVLYFGPLGLWMYRLSKRDSLHSQFHPRSEPNGIGIGSGPNTAVWKAPRTLSVLEAVKVATAF